MLVTSLKNLAENLMPKTLVNRLSFVFVISSLFFGLLFDHSTYVESYYSAFRRSNNAIKDFQSEKCKDLVSVENKKLIIENSKNIEFAIALEEVGRDCKNLINEISVLADHLVEISEKSIGDRFEREYAWYIFKNDAQTGFLFFVAAIIIVGLMKMTYKIIGWVWSGKR